MIRRLAVLAFAPLALLGLARGAELALPPVVSAYVAEALERNLALTEQLLDVEQAQARLAQVRSALQPRLDMVARYSVADGGRTIDFPAGDLLNGVYGTLNDYLRQQGRPAAFPALENQSIPLLRDREQETKLRLVQPLWRPELTRQARAAREFTAARTAQLASFRRELRLTVIAAYFNYLQAEAAVAIYGTTGELTAEAVRTNRELAAVDKLTDEHVLRAEAEDLAVRQQLAEAVRDRNASRQHFNFLLNRPLDADITAVPGGELERALAQLADQPAASPVAPSTREELQLARHAVAAAAAAEDAVRARLYPSLALAVEGGVQGESYRSHHAGGFVQGSLVAELNVWDGRQRRSELQQARLERRRAELQLRQWEQRVELQAHQASDALRASMAAYSAARRRREASERAFERVRQRELIGAVNQLNFLDARAELTRSQLNAAIASARLFIAAATLERATAADPVP